MASLRHERVRKLLKREIGELIRRQYSLERHGLITVADIQMGSDLKSARVFIGVVGDSRQKQNALQRLQKDRPAIQQEIASRVILKYLPQLRFVLDASLERGDRVLEIMEEIKKSENTKPLE